jgi:hypothetical protein
MHQQIKGSPDTTVGNIHRVVNALARRGINIEAIAPDFDAPHVRVLVDHAEPYDPSNASDPFNRALAAMEEEGMAPQIKAGVVVSMPNKPGALQAALQRITRQGFVVEAILVLPGEPSPGVARVAFGVARTISAGWDDESGELQAAIEGDLDQLPDS